MATSKAVRADLEHTLQAVRAWKDVDPDSLATRADVYRHLCGLICDLQSAFIAPPAEERPSHD